MFNVFRSNQQRRLADAFSEVMESPLGSALDVQDWIGVQSRPMEAWLKAELSTRIGIFAGARFSFPRALVEHLLGRVGVNQGNDWGAFGRECLTWSIMKFLPEFIGRPGFEDLSRYVGSDKDGVKKFQLCHKIAGVFDEYTVYRPEMILSWERDRPTEWQAELWNRLVEENKFVHVARGAKRYLEAVERGEVDFRTLPRISLFGISSLPPLFLQVLFATGFQTEVNLFTLSPSSEFWAHVQSKRGRGTQGIEVETDPDLHLETGNTLLASMGNINRDFQTIVEDVGSYHEPRDDLYQEPLDSENRTLLRMLKSDVLHFIDRSAHATEDKPLEIGDDDFSVQIHSCHSSMREVEVLHDRLLALLDDKELDLHPDEVLVMIPEIKTYAPFIEAVFSSGPNGSPAIPYNVSDMSSVASSIVATAFFSILDLAKSRVTLNEVFELLRLEPVRGRFEFDENDVDTLEQWAGNAGIRWGIDGAHREQYGQPAFEQNTWRFGLNRLFLGYAMPGKDEVLFEGVLPYDEIEGTQAALLGQFASFCEILFSWVKTARVPHSASKWAEIQKELVQRLMLVNDQDSIAQRQLLESLNQVSVAANKAVYDGEIALEVMRLVLLENLEAHGSGGSNSKGSVTFCGALPMRTIPFKVVCLMGMGYRDFPRSDRVPGFDLMAQKPRMGDRSRRLDDRHTFLTALLSAQDRLIITYVGQNIQNGERVPASVLVEELMGTVENGFFTSGTSDGLRSRLLVEHPLQPFSPRYFEQTDDRLFSYFDENCKMAKETRTVGKARLPFTSNQIGELESRQEVSISDLVDFFKLPSRNFLTKRLGISLGWEEGEASSREPLSPDPLDNFVVGTALAEKTRNGFDSDELFTIFKAKGVLPLGALGEVRFDSIKRNVDCLLDAAAEDLSKDVLPPLEIEVELEVDKETTFVKGRLVGVRESGLVATKYGSVKAKDILENWIKHLLVTCALPKERPICTVLWGIDKQKGVSCVKFLPVENDAPAILSDLVRLFFKGASLPLCLFPDVSFAYAKVYAKQLLKLQDTWSAKAMAMEAARREWDKSYEISTPAIDRVFSGTDPLGENEVDSELGFESLAIAVFGPILKHMEQ